MKMSRRTPCNPEMGKYEVEGFLEDKMLRLLRHFSIRLLFLPVSGILLSSSIPLLCFPYFQSLIFLKLLYHGSTIKSSPLLYFSLFSSHQLLTQPPAVEPTSAQTQEDWEREIAMRSPKIYPMLGTRMSP